LAFEKQQILQKLKEDNILIGLEICIEAISIPVNKIFSSYQKMALRDSYAQNIYDLFAVRH